MTNFITRDAAQNANDIQFEDVPVDEWTPGAVIRIVGMNSKEASSYSRKLVEIDQKGIVKNVRMDSFMEDLIIRTACDENFNRLFTKDDKEWLSKKSAKVLKRLSDVAARLSGISDDAEKNAIKNSDGITDEEESSD